MGVQPYSDLLGLGDPEPVTPPAIECLACGTRWRDIDAFNAGRPEPSATSEDAAPSTGTIEAATGTDEPEAARPTSNEATS